MIDFTNDVFGRLITYESRHATGVPTPRCVPPGPLLDHGTVSLLGVERHDDLVANQRNAEIGSADALRLREAADVAATVSTALADGWPVFDEAIDALRPCRPGDICILLPTRISLPSLEAELRRAGLAYRAENSSVVYATTEIRQLLLALRAADDPTDTLALVEIAAQPALRMQRRRAVGMEVRRWHLEPLGGAAGRLWPTIRSPTPSPTSGRSPNGSGARRPPICSPRSPTSGAPSTSHWPAPTPATCGAACGS